MERTQWYIGVPNGVVVCIDEIAQCRMNGRIYHAYSREAMKVTNMSQLLFELDDFFDSICYPFPSRNERSFQDKEPKAKKRKERMKVMSDEELLSRHGDLGTFIIRVQHRQNSSWQGRITWMDKDKTMHFRSVWEMIKLMGSALETVYGEESLTEETWPEE